MSTQATREVPAFIYIFTEPSDAIEGVAGLTLTAVGTQLVDASMSSTDIFRVFTLININAARAVFIEVVSSTTVNGVPLADVGANCVDADLPSVAWTCLTNTLIDIDAASEGVLDKTSPTRHLGKAAERPLGVLALKLWATVMDAGLTLIDIFAVVGVEEFIASPTADLSLATERALCVDTTLSTSTVTGTQQTLVDVLTAFSIWFEFVSFETDTGVVPHTLVSTFPIAFIT